MFLITLNTIDCIVEDKCKGEFENLDTCIEQCKLLEVNVFVVKLLCIVNELIFVLPLTNILLLQEISYAIIFPFV